MRPVFLPISLVTLGLISCVAGSNGNISGTGGDSSGLPATGTGGDTSVVVPAGPPIMGYILNLAPHGGAVALDALNYQNVDYVIHAFYTADAANNLIPVQSNVDEYRNAGIVNKVHAAGKRIVLSAGGATDSAPLKAVMTDPNRIAAFTANVVARLNEWGYDGIDLDLEFPTNDTEKAQHLSFVQSLYNAVKANDPNDIVMFGVSPGYYIDRYAWAELANSSDYAFYFCYDWRTPALGPMKKPGSGLTLSSGQRMAEASCSGAINYMMGAGYPAAKIISGFGFYSSDGYPYFRITDSLKSAPYDANYMEVLDSSNNTWWPTAAALTAKVNAVLDPTQSALTGGVTIGGVGYWEWGYEDPAWPDLSTAIRTRVDQL